MEWLPFPFEINSSIFGKKTNEMDTLTIEIRNPKVRELIDSLVDMDLIAILPRQGSWRQEWRKLSDTLPDTSDISEEEIFEEIQAVRSARQAHL
ncbi:hypothetical protein GCM10007390_49790 [Persicitalea jodogahamensis]|uniref:Uncharacterized protein n=2 Tax=Persicitalea jodogahamensis TaxID=402147 RepID=A0A8J3DFX9_9BACT|nr:hypothetical protein GCM10007390_49790 [Persicitalea jodogahamensis]